MRARSDPTARSGNARRVSARPMTKAGKKAAGKKKKSVKAADSSIKKTKSKASVKTKKKGKGK